jgi:zinc protease
MMMCATYFWIDPDNKGADAVRSLKLSIILFTLSALAAALPGATALSQSGRGRPKVPQPSSPAQPAQPVIVPAATLVIKQEQAGTTSRFVLHNGITVVINEQHATPIVAVVACFKPPQLERWGINGAAKLLERLILNGTLLRPGEHGLGELRALGASFEAGSWQGSTNYSLVVSPSKLKEALSVQAAALQNPSLNEEAIRREIPLVIEEERLGAARDRGLTSSGAFTTRTLTLDNENAVTRLMSFDDPAAYSMTRLIDMAFNGSPMNFANSVSPANPVNSASPAATGDSTSPIGPGNMNALRSITREQVLESYRSRYRPENLIVSIVGDVSTYDTLVLIQQLYGSFGERSQTTDTNSRVGDVRKRDSATGQRASRSASPSENSKTREVVIALQPDQAAGSKPTPAPATAQDKLIYAADRADISQSIVSVGFHVPGTESKDSAAVEVLAALLGQGRGSRLSRSLIDGQMATNRIESNYLARQKTGILTVQMWCATDSREGSSLDKAESTLFKVLDNVRREIPTEGQMARAKTVLEKKFLDETATYLGRATALAQTEAGGRESRSALDYRARIRAVSGADVQRAAAAHLTITNASIYEYEPFSAAARTFDSDTFAKTVITWAPGFAQPIESGSVRPAEAAGSLSPVPQGVERSAEQRTMMESVQPLPIKDFSTLNGPKAFVREDHSQPKVTIAILFQGGRVTEDVSSSGTTELMLRSILYGTPRRTFMQVSDELEQLGADVRIVTEPDFFGFIVSALSRNAERALKLVRDEIEEPAFKDEDVARARLGQISSIREARDLSVSRSRELLLQAMFPGHPYSLPPHGREMVITSLTSDQLREWHSRVVKRQVPIAIIVGDTDGSALVSAQIAEGFKRRDVDNATQIKVPQLAKAAEKIEQSRREQTTAAIGFAGPKADSGDVTAVQLIDAAMNSEGGRLLSESGDKQSVISAAALDDADMFVAGVISVCAVMAPENEQRARAALLARLEGLTRGGMTTNELASTRALMATSRLALLQGQSRHALEYARAIFYRRQVAEVDNFGEQSAKVSVDDIKRVASAYFKVHAASAGIVRGTAFAAVPSSPKN